MKKQSNNDSIIWRHYGLIQTNKSGFSRKKNKCRKQWSNNQNQNQNQNRNQNQNQMEFKNYIKQAGLDSKQYQQAGVEWCVDREKSVEFCKGGIIADEMGLGKTIMMIGTILQNFQMPNLIVLPLVLLEQWKEQFEKTTGHTPLVYHGASKKDINIERLQECPVVLTTYGTMVYENKTNQKLEQVSWKRVIFDEAHHLRNKQTKCVQSAKALQCDIKWLITGTPIQNHINDLYSLFAPAGRAENATSRKSADIFFTE